MMESPYRSVPYVDWRIDLWKVLVLGFLFALLLWGALVWV